MEEIKTNTETMKQFLDKEKKWNEKKAKMELQDQVMNNDIERFRQEMMQKLGVIEKK